MPYYVGVNIVSDATVATVARNAGFQGADLVTAVAISFAEDPRRDADVINYCGAGAREYSVGLWQINLNPTTCGSASPVLLWTSTRGTPQQLQDPQYNADVAYSLYVGRGGAFGDWSTFTGGQYLNHIAEAQAAVAAISGPPPPPAPPPVTEMATSLASGVSVGVGTVVGLPITVNNLGMTRATGVVFAAAIDASLLNDLSWEPTPYYYVSGQLISVLLPDLAPGQQWSGTVLIRGRGAASVGIVAKVTAANAPDAVAGTTVRVFSTSTPPVPTPTPAPTPGPVAVLESGFPFVLAMGVIVGLGYYSWRVEHPRARGKGAAAGLAALVAIPVLPP